MSNNKKLTTASGNPIADNQNSLTKPMRTTAKAWPRDWD